MTSIDSIKAVLPTVANGSIGSSVVNHSIATQPHGHTESNNVREPNGDRISHSRRESAATEPNREEPTLGARGRSHSQQIEVNTSSMQTFSSPLSTSSVLAPLTIGFENVTVVVDKHVMLDSVSGCIRSGFLSGIVSCCGARGDYMLLNALAGHEECGGGTILANGTPVFAPSFRSSSVFIDEDFTALDELTVRQNLQYAAAMRVASLDSDTVDSIVELLGLEGVEKKPVGRCSLYTRRRVALGKELLLRPRAIFVDQPVQGLPTHEARQFLQILRRIAKEKDRIVVVTLVQPRWVLLELLDDVILLESRKIAFSGTSSELLSVMKVDPENIPESTLTSMYRTAASPESSLVEAFRKTGHAERNSSMVQHFLGQCAAGSLTFDATPYVRPRAHIQFLHLVRYSLDQIRNNVIVYSTFFAVVLVLSIILAAIYSSQTGQSGMQNRIGIIFFLVSSTFLHNMLFVESRKKEYLSFQRHRAHGYYGAFTYLLFTVISTAFVRFFSSAIFTIIVYSLGNIGNEWEYVNLRDLVAIVALTSFSTNLAVYFVCALARTARMAHFVLFAWYTFDVILAGIILNVNTLPKPFQVVSLASHIRLGYEAAVVTQFVGQDFGCSKATSNQTISCYNGDQYLNFLGFSPSRRWPNVEILLIMSACTMVAWYCVMVFYKSPRKMN